MRKDEPAKAPAAAAPRRLLRFLAIAAALILLLVALLAWLLQPPRGTGVLLDRVGVSLGLHIRAGSADYRLRGTPQLVLRDVVAQRQGDAAALLRAERVFVSLPWSTIRARGEDLTVQRIELDAPVLDVPALQRWLATRPPSEETRIPTLRDGMHVARGRIINHDWSIDGIEATLPFLSPTDKVDARLRGRYLDPQIRMPFDLDIALTRPANGAGMAVIGGLTVEGAGWTLPARVRIAGPMNIGEDEVRISPARIGMSARYIADGSNLPFVLGAHGPLLFNEAVLRLDPASLVLRGAGPIPDARARGAFALGQRLVLRLAGDIAAWPQAWPALPPPLSASTSRLPFALDYVGRADSSDIAALRLRRDQTSMDARFHLPVVLAWMQAEAGGSPLPPLQGRLRTPRVDVAGAQLEGVDIEFDDPAIAPAP